VDWARIAGLISHAETTRLAKHNPDGSETVRLHREICNFREKLRLLFIPPAKNDSDYLAAVASVELAISRLRPLARIDRENLALTWATPVEAPRDLKARIFNAAAELLAEIPREQIKTCGGYDCDWLFVDRTKAMRRLWCDTRTCGNIARVRRYRAKRRVA